MDSVSNYEVGKSSEYAELERMGRERKTEAKIIRLITSVEANFLGVKMIGS